MKTQCRTAICLVLAFSLVVGWVSRAGAQWHDSMGGSFNNPISSGLSSAIWGNMQMQMNLNMQRMMMQNSMRRGQQGRTAPAPRALQPVSGTTTFQSTPSPLMPQQLAAAMGKTPDQRKQLEQLLALCLDVFKKFEPQARPQSMRQAPINDVARSLGYYIAINYYVYAQGSGSMPKDVSEEQYEALCTMLRNFLLQNRDFQALSHQQKQQIHEALAIMGSLPLLGYQTAAQQKNQAQQETARQLAAQNLGRLGMSPEKMQFTNAGLVIQ